MEAAKARLIGLALALTLAATSKPPDGAAECSRDGGFHLRFNNSFLHLPGDEGGAGLEKVSRQVLQALWAPALPSPLFPPAKLLGYSRACGELLGLPNSVQEDELFRKFVTGEAILNVSYAHAYGGHQFGMWAGQLGDGRAINLGSAVSAQGGGTWELQLKGAGQTPFSRNSDGRAVLRSSVREFLASEFMHAAGVPTSRALTLAAQDSPTITRDQFYDGNVKKEPGAIVLRMAPTWVRFGTFEILYSRKEVATLRRLADFVIEEHMPQIVENSPSGSQRYLELLKEVVRRSARMVAHWQCVGFVHGVMNTDNMSILGLTIDFGPFGFMERFDPSFVPNTSDDESRYAYSKQPSVVLWNLQRLATALSPILPKDHDDKEQPRDHVEPEFWATYRENYRGTMLRRLHVAPGNAEEDDKLIEGLLSWMQRAGADWTNTFSSIEDFALHWSSVCRGTETATDPEAAEVTKDIVAWIERVSLDLPMEPSLRVELRGWLQMLVQRSPDCTVAFQRLAPLYVPRNYLMHEAIEALHRDSTNSSTLLELLDALSAPLTRANDVETHERLVALPPAWARRRGVSQLSCSS